MVKSLSFSRGPRFDSQHPHVHTPRGSVVLFWPVWVPTGMCYIETCIWKPPIHVKENDFITDPLLRDIYKSNSDM